MIKSAAVEAPNQFVETKGRTLAYRSIGEGRPIVLCTRFKGNLDQWDPAFLEALAAQGFRVITFDYSGLGLSTGERSYNPFAMVKDPLDLVDALGIDGAVIAGWSIGGMVAQVALTSAPERFARGVLIATTPPGPLVKMAEQLFYDLAMKPHNTDEENIALFFEPKSSRSRAAATRSLARIAQRTTDLSVPVPADWAASQLGKTPKPAAFPADVILQGLKKTTVPILHIGADHDIIFPVENWYALNQTLPTVQLITYPVAGHAPHHQHPDASAAHIAAFVRDE